MPKYKNKPKRTRIAGNPTKQSPQPQISGIRSKTIEEDSKNINRKEIEGTNNLNYYLEYNNATERSTWISSGDKGEEYYFGRQFTDEEININNERGQMAVAINDIRPLIKHFVSLCTANNPAFTVTSVNKEDNIKSWIFRGIMAKILRDNQISRHGVRAIFDMVRRGMGNLVVDYDPHARYGKGEVVITYATNREVVWDNTCTAWNFSDSENVIYTKVVSLGKAIVEYPEKEAEIIKCKGKYTEDFQSRYQQSETEEGAESQVGVDYSHSSAGVSFVRLIIRYTKRKIPVWVVTFPDGKQHEYYSESRFNKYIEINNLKENVDYQLTKLELVRIVKFTSILDTLLDVEILPIDEYPIIPFVCEDTHNAFPQGEVHHLYPMQRVINKCVGITIYNAQIASNPRVYIDKSAITEDEKKQIENKSAQPGAIITEVSKPKENVLEIGGHPLNPAFFQIAERLQSAMEYEMSISRSELGDMSETHRTYKGIMAMHEWGKRNVALVIKGIQDSYTLMGRVVLQFIQANYKVEDVIRLTVDDVGLGSVEKVKQMQAQGVDIDGNELIVQVNKAINDAGQVVRYLNDLSVGDYDVATIPDSFMYTDRQAKLAQMVEMKQYNIVDGEAVLDETDFKDRDEIKKRMSLVNQLTSTVEQTTKAIEKKDQELELMKKELERTDRKLVKAEMTSQFEKVLIELNSKIDSLDEVTKSLTKGNDKSSKSKKPTKSGKED